MEEDMDLDDVDDGDGEGEDEIDETGGFKGENGMEFVALVETENGKAGNNPGPETDGVKELIDKSNVNYLSEQPLWGSEEAKDGVQEDSDGWMYEDMLVDEDDSCLPWTVSDEQNESLNKDCGVKNACILGPSGPHLRTSAITGVGLQELLELIDEKLKVQDEKLKTAKMVEGSIFDKKWRPPRTEDSGIAVEQ